MFEALSRPRADRPSSPSSRSPRTDNVIQLVLRMLREQLGMDVVHVGHYVDGERRFRVVEALHHGRAAALATSPELRTPEDGDLLEAPIVLPNGRVHGVLCCYDAGGAADQAERQLRLLRHGARLAARLLDNEEVLLELARKVPRH